MRRHNKMPAALAALLLLPALTGCQDGALRMNYREVEQLQVIQTLGMDRAEDGQLCLSAASGAGMDGQPPTIMSVEADAIETAMERLQDYAFRDALFFPHTSYLVLGEAAARDQVAACLDYVDRAPQMRSSGVSLFVLYRGEARTLLTGAGDETHDVTDELRALEANAERTGSCRIYNCTEVARRLAESGAALVSAISPADTEGIVFSGGGGLSTLPAGYAVLRDGQLTGYILGDTAKGADLLDGGLSGGAVTVEDRGGSRVTLTIPQGKSGLEPVWAADGRLQALEVEVDIHAALRELEQPALLAQPDFLSRTAAVLAERVRGWVTAVLACSAEQNADFLALGQTLRRSHPARFDAMPLSWAETLPGLDFRVSVNVAIQHGYERTGAVRLDGSGRGGTE